MYGSVSRKSAVRRWASVLTITGGDGVTPCLVNQFFDAVFIIPKRNEAFIGLLKAPDNMLNSGRHQFHPSQSQEANSAANS